MSYTASPKRLLLIDDHTLFRTGLRLMLAENPLIGQIDEAGSVMQALEHPQKQVVELILLDIHLPGINGLNGAVMLKKEFTAAAILIVSGSVGAITIRDAQALGLSGFVLKSADPTVMEQAVVRCLQGEHFFAEHFSLAATESQHGLLSPRQIEVLLHLARGKPNKVIARDMDLSEHTVRGHIAVIFDLLGTKTRTEAVIEAQRRGLINNDT